MHREQIEEEGIIVFFVETAILIHTLESSIPYRHICDFSPSASLRDQSCYSAISELSIIRGRNKFKLALGAFSQPFSYWMTVSAEWADWKF